MIGKSVQGISQVDNIKGSEQTEVTMEELQESFTSFCSKATRYLLDQEVKVRDCSDVEYLAKMLYNLGDRFRNYMFGIQGINYLSDLNQRRLLVCSDTLTPSTMTEGVIMETFQESSKVGQTYARRQVARLKRAKVYLYDPNSDELLDVTPDYTSQAK